MELREIILELQSDILHVNTTSKVSISYSNLVFVSLCICVFGCLCLYFCVYSCVILVLINMKPVVFVLGSKARTGSC